MSESLGPEALRKLEQAALDCMEKRLFTEALVLWETRLRGGETGSAPFPLYALCLAEVGRVEEAKVLCEKTGKAIAELEAGDRRNQLQLLLSQVVRQLPGGGARPGEPLPSPDPDALFGGGSEPDQS